ncbi:MAG: type II secretion system F family protein, partial [Dokdonella sp.]
MTIFQYKAVTAAGETIEGQYDVASSDDVIAKLHDAGNIPLEVRQADSGDAASLFAAMFKRATLREAQVVQFTQQLATLLGAGQPLDRALQILLDLPETDKAKRMFERIRDKVRGGDPLSDALEEETGSFSKLYVNIVRAGEAGGSLDGTLARLADYLDRSRQLKSTVINAMIYPAFLVGMVMVSLLILLTYVVPQFVPMFTDMGVDMPLLTRVVMAVGSTLQNFWWLLLILIFGAVGWVRRQLNDPERRLVFDQRLLNMKL